MTPGRWSIGMVLFGIAGASLDQFHTRLGVLSYQSPVLFGQGWWTIPLFGVGFAILLAIGMVVVRQAGAAIRVPTRAQLIGSTLIFVAAYFMSCFDFGHPWSMLGIFTSVWIARVLPLSGRAYFIGYSLLVALLGTSLELTLTSTGIYWFHRPDIWTVPAWLPGLYLTGAPLGLLLAKKL